MKLILFIDKECTSEKTIRFLNMLAGVNVPVDYINEIGNTQEINKYNIVEFPTLLLVDKETETEIKRTTKFLKDIEDWIYSN